jgi:hypothetical protein
VTVIWRKQEPEWRPLLPSGFPSEAALHDLVEEAPHLLPLSGDPSLVVVGREVAIGPGWADLLAVETDGRVAIIEIKLRRNAEARRAVVAQILTYASYLKGTDAGGLGSLLAPHLSQSPFASIADALRETDQSGNFDPAQFDEALSECLANGSFRLVLVLDEAPTELVQLVGYLESVSAGVVIDLVTVSAYEVGDEQILVPQRVDPDDAREAAVPSKPTPGKAKRPRPIDGTEPFEEAIGRAAAQDQPRLSRLLAWAKDLERRKLATLKSVLGQDRQILLVWLPGEKAGLVSIWNDSGPYVSLWRSVFVRHAWEQIEPIEMALGTPIGQGNTVRDPSDEVLVVIGAAYEAAARSAVTWDGVSLYVSFGEGAERSWDDARRYGFVSAGGGAWYSNTLRQLSPGNRIYVYIPKGNGVGGYVGVGDVTGEAQMASEFLVDEDGTRVALTDVASAPDMARDNTTDPEVSEWVVPVRWIATRSRDEAIKDSDFFANQNSAARLTHGYTLNRLRDAFELDS